MMERTNEQLLAGYRDGSRDDFNLLRDRWHARLLEFFAGWRVGAEEAEGMAQLVWRRVGQNAHAFSPGRDFAAWVHMTSMSLYRDSRRFGVPTPAATPADGQEGSRAEDPFPLSA